MKEVQAHESTAQSLTAKHQEVEKKLQHHKNLGALLEAQQRSLQAKLNQIKEGSPVKLRRIAEKAQST